MPDLEPHENDARDARDERPRASPEPVTWRQLGRDLVRPSRVQLAFGLILLICGLALTVQLRGNDERRYSTLRQSELVSILDDVTAETRRIEADIADLTDTKQQLQTGADASAVAAEQARQRLDALEIMGGTVAARGPGIRVTIVDPAGNVDAEVILSAIDELRDAGAEVLEFNDEVRLVASSWVRGEPDALVVDGVRLRSPYQIEAIGDARTLAEATRFRGGLVSTIEGERVQGRVQVVELAEVAIDAVRTPSEPRFARPA